MSGFSGILRVTPGRHSPCATEAGRLGLALRPRWGSACAVAGLDGLLPCPPPSPLRGEHPAFSRVPAARWGVIVLAAVPPRSTGHPTRLTRSETWVLAAQLGLLSSGGGRHCPPCAWARTGACTPGGVHGVSRARRLPRGRGRRLSAAWVQPSRSPALTHRS